jgi:hypothetical protein
LKPIVSQPFSNIIRSIENNQQITTEEKEYLLLYNDKIITPENHFSLHEVLDVSFRQFSSFEGLLYLHTNQGVFSYRVPSAPDDFINEFRGLKL